MHRHTIRVAATAVYAACMIGTAHSETFIYAKPIAGEPNVRWETIAIDGSPAFFRAVSSTGFRLDNLVNGILDGNHVFNLASTWINGRQITNWSTYGTTYTGLVGQISTVPAGFLVDYPTWTSVEPFLPEQVAAITIMPALGHSGFNYRIDTLQSTTEWANRVRIEWLLGLVGLSLFPLLLRIKLPARPKLSQETRLRFALERAHFYPDLSQSHH